MSDIEALAEDIKKLVSEHEGLQEHTMTHDVRMWMARAKEVLDEVLHLKPDVTTQTTSTTSTTAQDTSKVVEEEKKDDGKGESGPEETAESGPEETAESGPEETAESGPEEAATGSSPT